MVIRNRKLLFVDNQAIISLLKSIATLLTLHGANPFQVKHYHSAAMFLEQIEQDLGSLSQDELFSIQGMSKSIVGLIQEINESGTLQRWEELMAKTPQGLLEILELRGMGPKKVRTLWKELGIECLEELSQACASGQVALFPGFGRKTQEAIQESLAWRNKAQNTLHYAKALPYATALAAEIQEKFPDLLIAQVGAFRRKEVVIKQITLLIGVTTTTDIEIIKNWLNLLPNIQQAVKTSGPFAWRGKLAENDLKLIILFCPQEYFYQQLVFQTGSSEHLALPIQENKTLGELIARVPHLHSEVELYQQVGLPYIPPEIREGQIELAWGQAGAPKLLALSDLRGVFHIHTNYSDGDHDLEAMARYCIELGYEYMGIADHSQSAIYAGGLNVEAIQEQHQAIDRLNEHLAPFKIFKGIESDILADGSLDYIDEILSTFDFIIASIHTGLSMNQQKATERLIRAINNPFTTILGHLTGRLLLKRAGYPIDHRAVIDACAARGVIIEINASPWRLELDWQWVHYAIEQKVWLSINPDAHNQADIHNMGYGVDVGRKGGLTKQYTFNALSQREIEQYFLSRKTAFSN